MEKLRIGYFADGPWSHNAFELLQADNSIEVKFIVPRSDTQDSTLHDYCEKYGISYYTGAKINSEAFYEWAQEQDCDLFVSMSFNQIFKSKIINLPPMKTINCHAGKLPFYRGRNILNWVLINDEADFGITVHYIDEGIDTGDIILQKSYPITEGDNYKTLLEIAYTECSIILYEAIKQLQNGTSARVPQSFIHEVGTYYGMRQEGDEVLYWDQTSREIFNFVRAICSPGPQARTLLKGKEMKINSVALIPNAVAYKATKGQIVGKDGDILIVKTADTILKITDYTYDGKIRIGDRFEHR